MPQERALRNRPNPTPDGAVERQCGLCPALASPWRHLHFPLVLAPDGSISERGAFMFCRKATPTVEDIMTLTESVLFFHIKKGKTGCFPVTWTVSLV